MNALPSLSKLFHPVQPRFREGGADVIYREFTPDVLLSGYICCYWQLESVQPLSSPFLYNAVADGCIDLFFDIDRPNENFVMGFSSGYTSFALERSFRYAGIRFFPGAFPLLYNIRASELTNQCQYISTVMPRAHHAFLNGLLANVSCIGKVRPQLDHYFKKLVSSNEAGIDSRFAESLGTILQSGGTLYIEKDITASVSSRHLRRLFDFYVGAAPKEFNRIVRFQKLLGNITRHSLKKDKTYYDAGYYDQSHFIRDFKALYGVAPLKALSASPPSSSEQ